MYAHYLHGTKDNGLLKNFFAFYVSSHVPAYEDANANEKNNHLANDKKKRKKATAPSLSYREKKT